MPTHTDLIYIYELTKKALENIKDLEKQMKSNCEKKMTRKKYTRRKRKNIKKTRRRKKKYPNL
uniref:Uncharacterized protein n=1 Tax=viral metagenome TaxID=1070528 RepID=A0A6C0JCQ4_9ZZZZ|tara:strand:- start:147 stop:335 length:189 start_codon:yes stop_codon:yes gene_type:complete